MFLITDCTSTQAFAGRSSSKSCLNKDSVRRTNVLLHSLVAVFLLVFSQGIPVDGKKTQKVAAISINVSPHVVLINPYKRVTFVVIFRITEHPDNRVWSYAATCGAEEVLSQRPVTAISTTRYEELTVLADCFFQACVHRVVEGKVKNFCAKKEVPTTGQPP